MLTLSQHIEYLISRHDCVILPGIGAFIAVSRSAEFDKASGSFLPPRRIISFNPAVVNDDGLVAHSIARKERISFEEARRQLEFKLSGVSLQLKEHGKCSFGKVGSLISESDGRMTFHPAMTLQQKEHKSGVITISLPVAESADRTSVRSSGKSGESLSPLPSDVRNPEYYILRIPKIFVRTAASVLIMVCALVSLLIPSGDTMKNTSKASVVEVESIIKAVESKTSQPRNGKNEKISPENVEPEQSADDLRFHLIVGTFASEENANEFIAAHPNSGLYLLPGKGHCRRVSASSSDNRNELQQMLNDRQIRNSFPGAWIWEKK